MYAFPLERFLHSTVTGVVIAARGTVLDTGELAIHDLAVPGLVLLPGVR